MVVKDAIHHVAVIDRAAVLSRLAGPRVPARSRLSPGQPPTASRCLGAGRGDDPLDGHVPSASLILAVSSSPVAPSSTIWEPFTHSAHKRRL